MSKLLGIAYVDKCFYIGFWFITFKVTLEKAQEK